MVAVDSWLVNLLIATKARYKLMYGGRGGGKSVAIADALLLLATQKKIIILCTRQFMGSIEASVHPLLSRRIADLGLSGLFTVRNNEVECKNGSVFLFKGLERGVESLQGVDSVNYCWIEEAQTISSHSWKILTPSIRGNGAEIWCSMNPQNEDDAIYNHFFNTETPYIDLPSPMNSRIQWQNEDGGSLVIKVNWNSNPYFPDVLNNERLRCLRNNPQEYANIWEGELSNTSEANIFKDHWLIEDFTVTPDFGYPFYGMDFGYSNDPNTLVKCYLFNDRLYIEKSAGTTGLDINDIPTFFSNAFNEDLSRASISADCSLPQTIEYLRQNGFNGIHPCKKWQGSIIDGINYLKSVNKIIVKPNCEGVIHNLRNYSNKVDKRNDKILPVPEDKNNDYIDAIRYALDAIIKKDGSYWHLFDKIGDDFNEVF